GGQLDMALAAELAGLPTEELHQLNAGVNRWATDPDGPHRMIVPLTHAEGFAAAVTELDERERVRWTRHRIASGETLSHIADRYATTAAVLRQINGLRGNLIRAGDYLMIPHALEPYESYALSADARLASTQSQDRGGERVVHAVRSGES